MLHRFSTIAMAFMAVSIFHASPSWAGFTLNGDGTFTDNTSAIVWDTCHLGRTGIDCVGAAENYSWAGAQSAATALNQTGQHGFNDWCVPTFAVKNALWSNLSDTVPNNIPDWHWTSNIIGGAQWVTSFMNGGNSAGVSSALARPLRHQGDVYGADAPCGTTLSSALSGTTATSTTLTVTVTNGASGTGYWIAIISGGTPPIDMQVQAGTAYEGATVAGHGSGPMVPGNASTAFDIDGLSASTAYSVYFVARDGADNFSAVDGPQDFTTGEVPLLMAPTSVPTLSIWALLWMSGLLGAAALIALRRHRTQGI